MNYPMTNRPKIMGILNVTPDSFSDGGDFFSAGDAIEHALQMVDVGADIIDVGGESTRPGAKRINAEEQIQRVVPVIEGMRQRLPGQIMISIDTTLNDVVIAAVEAGAGMINDISAGEDDNEIFQFAAVSKIPIVIMHKQGTPESMQQDPDYKDVVNDVRTYLLNRADIAMQAGIKKENLILDPGFGFGKTKAHNLQILANLNRLVDSGFQIMIGTSRKTFLAKICDDADRKDLAGASCATTTMGVMAGVKLFRVHDVKENRQAADVACEALSVRG